MIICNCFEGDSEELMELQHDRSYSNVLSMIIRETKRRYAISEKVLNIETDIGDVLRHSDDIDHRVLQPAHDLLASIARYNVINKTGLLFLEPDEFIFEWEKSVHKKIIELFDQYPNMIGIIATAIATPNPDPKGIEAEDKLLKMLNVHFGDKLADIDSYFIVN